MFVLIGVAVGGALGAVSRYGVDAFVDRKSGVAFPLSTFVINVSGCLAVGFLVAAIVDRHRTPEWLRVGLVMGFCGGFTTFSTFAQETLDLVHGDDWLVAAASVVASVSLGVLAVALGLRLGRLA
jgi:fluoride exporter